MSFGDGLTLTNTATPVYMNVFFTTDNGFKIKIYGTNDSLLLEKTVNSAVLYNNNGKLINFPALEVYI